MQRADGRKSLEALAARAMGWPGRNAARVQSDPNSPLPVFAPWRRDKLGAENTGETACGMASNIDRRLGSPAFLASLAVLTQAA